MNEDSKYSGALSWDFMCNVTNSFSQFFVGAMLTIFTLTGLCAVSIILYVLGERECYKR